MDCDSAREAISALMDGEDPGLAGDVLAEHLAGCPACHQWQQQAHATTRRVRLGGHVLDHDLLPAVLSAVPVTRGGRGRGLTQRAGLIAVALAQMAVTVPLLILGHDHDAGTHAAHELGSFDLALAIAFVVGALRPALSAGLAWPCGAVAAALAGTAIADLIAGQAIGTDEAQHLIAVAGALLLVWQARSTRAAGPASVMVRPGRTWHPDRAGQPAVPRPEDSPARLGGSGDAARDASPEVA